MPSTVTTVGRGTWHHRRVDEDERIKRAKARLRAELDGVDLTPDETADDIAIRESSVAQVSRDEQLERDVPPHHGS